MIVATSSALTAARRAPTSVGVVVLAARDERVDRARVDLPHVLEGGDGAAHRVHLGLVLGGLDDDGDRAGVGEDPLDLLLRGGHVDRHADRARRPDREVQQRPLVAGGGEDRDPVTRADTRGDQALGNVDDLRRELRRAVTSCQRPPTLRRNTTAPGSSSAFVKIKSAMPPLAGISASAGTANSVMCFPPGWRVDRPVATSR